MSKELISNAVPTIKGFNRQGLYRMKQFYETYRDDEFVSALLTQIRLLTNPPQNDMHPQKLDTFGGAFFKEKNLL